MSNSLIVGADSDIAQNLLSEWKSRKWFVVGTTRRKIERSDDQNLFSLDLSSSASVDKFTRDLKLLNKKFDKIIFAAGTMHPIGNLVNTNVDEWESNIKINFLSPVRIIRQLISTELLNSNALILIFAGGGINSAPVNSSAYTISKIALTKSMEILFAEFPDYNFISLGTGWINTKIHKQTLDAGPLLSSNFLETVRRTKDNDFGDIHEILKFIDWVSLHAPSITSGRNFSLQNAEWKNPEFTSQIFINSSLFKLRRVDIDKSHL
jgi:NAD(P)-dependent dehydrogenase (short-subunit alcohol dehydrogenase family)